MTAGDSTPQQGQSADGSIAYDSEYQVYQFVEAQSDLLCDLAGEACQYDDLIDIAESYRELSREAAFIADVIEQVALKNREE